MASYIINAAGTELIAVTTANLPSGTEVQYAWQKSEEALNADRKFNLVNARHGKISTAKKWENIARHQEYPDSATEINPGEFFLD